MKREIAGYILANRDTYTRDAITQSLIRAGHDPGEIDAAWAAVEIGRVPIGGGSGEPSGGGAGGRGRFWLGFSAYLLALHALAYLLLGSDRSLRGAAELAGAPSDARRLLLTALGVGAFLSLALVGAGQLFRRGAASSVLVAFLIPFVIVVIIGGMCVSLGASPGFG